LYFGLGHVINRILSEKSPYPVIKLIFESYQIEVSSEVGRHEVQCGFGYNGKVKL